MTGHLTEETIELYRRHQLDPAARRESDAHLATCQDCLDLLLNSEHAVLGFSSVSEALLPSVHEEPFHISATDLKNYAAGKADRADQIICESHLEHCEDCQEDFRRLSVTSRTRQTRGSVNRFVPQSPSPHQTSRWFSPLRAAAVIAFVGLLLLALVLWRQNSTRDAIGRNEPSHAPTPAVSPAPAITPSVEQATPDSTAIALLKDSGAEIRLDHEGKLTGVESLDEPTQQMVRAALAGENLQRPAVLEGLKPPRIKLLGEIPSEISFKLISPMNQLIIEDQPTMKWHPLNGAAGYVVTVFDGNFNRVAQSPPLTSTEWRLAVPLTHGGNFLWEVSATVDGKTITAPAAPAPRAQFRVIEADKLATVTKLKQQQPPSHLARGLIYARLGLVNDAEREFRQLLSENPDSAVARKLLRTVQLWQTSK